MTVLEKYFVSVVDLMDSLGVDWFIHHGTLLGFVRNGKLLQRSEKIYPYAWYRDKEINIGMLAKDYTPAFQKRLKAVSKYFMVFNIKLPNGEILQQTPPALTFFSSYDLANGVTHWKLPGFSLLTLYYIGNTRAIEYLGSDYAFTWKREHVEDPSRWETMTVYGKKVKTPYKKEAYLERYFGKDYMTENVGWYFKNDARNKKSFFKLQQDGELHLKDYQFKT